LCTFDWTGQASSDNAPARSYKSDCTDVVPATTGTSFAKFSSDGAGGPGHNVIEIRKKNGVNVFATYFVINPANKLKSFDAGALLSGTLSAYTYSASTGTEFADISKAWNPPGGTVFSTVNIGCYIAKFYKYDMYPGSLSDTATYASSVSQNDPSLTAVPGCVFVFDSNFKNDFFEAICSLKATGNLVFVSSRISDGSNKFQNAFFRTYSAATISPTDDEATKSANEAKVAETIFTQSFETGNNQNLGVRIKEFVKSNSWTSAYFRQLSFKAYKFGLAP
jgi:hypothetical protein